MDQARLPSLGLQNKRKEAPSTGKTASVAEFLHVVSVAQVMLNRSVIVGTTSILVWDWLSCLPQEWRYIWKSGGGWSPVKVLYCFSCAQHVRILPGIAVIIDLVYALYQTSRRMGIFLVGLLAAFLGVMVAVPILAFDYTRLPSWPGPCIVTGKPSIAGPKFIIAFYASPIILNLRASSDARPGAKKFSNTPRGLENRGNRNHTLYLAIVYQPSASPRNSQLPPSSQEGIFRDGDSSSSKTQIESPTLDTLPPV
ncbi:hypothetical protein R3P38DRAFT_3048884 [Favolaschia claudopus]|uniref:DUF6533 domain-containing protein n=1 Tax=Favolaschia claudopus TaxID=2862362 RepID=A0AAW0A5R3_9AGAR